MRRPKLNRKWPQSPDIVLKSVHNRPCSPKIYRIRARIGQLCPKLAELVPGIGRVGAHTGRIPAKSGRSQPKLVEVKPTLAGVARKWPDAHPAPQETKVRQKRRAFAENWCYKGQRWRKIRSPAARSGPNAKLASQPSWQKWARATRPGRVGAAKTAGQRANLPPASWQRRAASGPGQTNNCEPMAPAAAAAKVLTTTRSVCVSPSTTSSCVVLCASRIPWWVRLCRQRAAAERERERAAQESR